MKMSCSLAQALSEIAVVLKHGLSRTDINLLLDAVGHHISGPAANPRTE